MTGSVIVLRFAVIGWLPLMFTGGVPVGLRFV